MRNSVKVITYCEVVPDDGLDGTFWRDGERWMRNKGEESRLLTLAPNLEAKMQMEIDLADGILAKIKRDQLAAMKEKP